MVAHVTVIGGGLAGSEAAWQLAKRNVPVVLWEMRPEKLTPAHKTGKLAELVCSNSLGANRLESAGGVLKEEMRLFDSLILQAAEEATVPAGGALAVDREIFASIVTERIENHPLITIRRGEVDRIPEEGIVIVASGPLTSDALAQNLAELTGGEYLYFYDAAAPIVTADSVDESLGFWASRYGKGTADYFNCPMNKEEYESFWRELVAAEVHEGHIEEDLKIFEGCMPIEVMAARGIDTLRFGPLKPVGLVDPRTGERPYAVVQLRKENRQGTLLNLVGFQTRLKWGEQRRVFRMIPALHDAEFVRYGVMHRNTFINSPKLLTATYQLRSEPRIFIAGQLTGVEGYVESAGSGLVAGINAARLYQNRGPVIFPEETLLGALAAYVSSAITEDFQPMNANFGLLPPLPNRIRDKQQRKLALAQRALEAIKNLAVD